MAGVLGENGRHALRSVELERSIAVVSAIDQVQHMVENIVLGKINRHGNATLSIVQLTAAGHYGQDGPPVLRRAGLGAKLGSGSVPTPHHCTEGRGAKGLVNRLSPALW